MSSSGVTFKLSLIKIGHMMKKFKGGRIDGVIISLAYFSPFKEGK